MTVRPYPALGTTANLTVRKVTAAPAAPVPEPMAVDIPTQPGPASPPASAPAPRNTTLPVGQPDTGRDDGGDSSTDDESDEGDGDGIDGGMRLPNMRPPGTRGFPGVPLGPAGRGLRTPPRWLSQEAHVRRAARCCTSAVVQPN